MKVADLTRKMGAYRHLAGVWLNAKRFPGRDCHGVQAWATAEEQAHLAREASTDFARLFYEHQGRPLLKWSTYLDPYDTHLARFRGTDVGLLEIGVFQGGSLELWRKFLGDEARILGVDIEPHCADVVDPPNRVMIGSQDDPAFLKAAAESLGRIDVVIDDGSHVAKHQQTSFAVLFPLLQPGGLYIIEDLHTAFWYPFGGGKGRPGTAVDLVRRLIDDLHGWHHDAPRSTDAREWVEAVHVYDSMAVIQKRRRFPPLAVSSGA